MKQDCVNKIHFAFYMPHLNVCHIYFDSSFKLKMRPLFFFQKFEAIAIKKKDYK